MSKVGQNSTVFKKQKGCFRHSLKSGPETRDLGPRDLRPQDPETWDPETREPDAQDSGTLTSRTLEIDP